MQIASESKPEKSINLQQNQLSRAYGCLIAALLQFLSPLQVDKGIYLCQGDGAGTSGDACQPGQQHGVAGWGGPMMGASSSSTQLLALFERCKGTSVLALLQAHQVLLFHSIL